MRTAVLFSNCGPRIRPSAAAAALLLLAATPAAGAPRAKSAADGTWVRISYRELLDPAAITRTGEKLVAALKRTSNRGDLQPFLDPYSSLLGYAVQMLAGPDPAPQVSLADRYPPGAAQPGWAAVLRAGKHFVSTDGRGRARVFVPGDDPRAAYRNGYSLLRHPLAAALVPGAPLEVEVFSYRNDYAAAELRLNPSPYRFRAMSFPPRGRALDLAELEAFFRQGGQLEGAELAPDEGLVLFASREQRQTVGGEAVTLADFAVAYRAAVHAGDAEAFVSLDKHRDPTHAAVNFGGLLEDTRIGKAVLAADMRFKTLCSGLDPVTHADVREQIRRAVPSFMSNSERRFVTNPAADLTQWVLARYWYYPDSCGVESDDNEHLAAITKTQLTADVERLGGAPRGKKPALPAFMRENIKDLNKNYGRYAALFPEYRDLSSAARLMALAAWLGRVRPAWLDLDGLLAVTLPPERTPRELPQLLSAEILHYPGAAPPSREYVFRNTRIQDLAPELDKKVAAFFGDPRHLAVFLTFKAGRNPEQVHEFTAEAARVFPDLRDRPVRELLTSTDDLHALLRTISAKLLSEATSGEPEASDHDYRRLEEVRARLAALPPATASAGPDDALRRGLEQELGEIMRKYHSQGRGAGMATVLTTQYTGGISLAPRLFTVKKSASRPALEKLKAARRGAGTTGAAAGWIRSGRQAATPAGAGRSAAAPAPAAAQAAAPAAKARPARGPAGQPRIPAGRAPAPPPPPVEPAVEIAPSRPAPSPALRSIAVPEAATPAGAPLVGRLGEGGTIVFTRAPR